MGLGEIPRIIRIIRIIRTVGLDCGNQSETYHCHCAISSECCVERCCRGLEGRLERRARVAKSRQVGKKAQSLVMEPSSAIGQVIWYSGLLGGKSVGISRLLEAVLAHAFPAV